MVESDVIQQIQEGLSGKIVKFFQKSPRRYYVDLKPQDIPEGASVLFKELGARFQIATGIHTPEGFEILYHFAFDSLDKVVTLKTLLDKDRPEIESIASIIKGAEWIEREMWELLGISFKNHPDLRHLLLRDDWPEGDFPLRQKASGKAS